MPSGASFITGYILILPWLSLNGAIMASGIHEASSSLLLASSPGTTPHLQEIFMGRCSEYQYVVNKTPFKQRQKNCTDLWKKFEQAFRYRDPCDVPMDRFDNFTESALHFIPEDKTLFWEQVYPFVLRYSHGGQRFTTLGDTITGYLVDKLNWCGQKEEPGFNYNFCPPWSTCNSSEYSFWRRTSVQFAKQTRGVAYVMLNGSAPSAYHRNSVFAMYELPNINVTQVKLLHALVMHDLLKPKITSCGTGTLKHLEQDATHYKIPFTCTDDPKDIMHLLCMDNVNAPICGFFSAAWRLVVSFSLSIVAVLLTTCINHLPCQ